MPLVTMQQLPQEIAQKRKLAKRITEAFSEVYNIDPQSVQLFFHEAALFFKR